MRLLWRSQLRKPSVLWSTSYTIHFQRSVSTKSSDPLRILFCGSDNFSIGSLRSLNDERQKDADSIASIDVVCRPGKRVGRDLKTVREGKMQRIRIIF
jgi:methionyl-tRNA formyltransferase